MGRGEEEVEGAWQDAAEEGWASLRRHERRRRSGFRDDSDGEVSDEIDGSSVSYASGGIDTEFEQRTSGKAKRGGIQEGSDGGVSDGTLRPPCAVVSSAKSLQQWRDQTPDTLAAT